MQVKTNKWQAQLYLSCKKKIETLLHFLTSHVTSWMFVFCDVASTVNQKIAQNSPQKLRKAVKTQWNTHHVRFFKLYLDFSVFLAEKHRLLFSIEFELHTNSHIMLWSCKVQVQKGSKWNVQPHTQYKFVLVRIHPDPRTLGTNGDKIQWSHRFPRKSENLSWALGR